MTRSGRCSPSELLPDVSRLLVDLPVHPVYDLLVLLLVALAHAGGGGGTNCPPNVPGPGLVPVDLTGGGHDAGEAVRVRSHVLGLLLREHNLSVREPPHVRGDPIERERSDLLNPYQGHVLPALLLPLGQELVVDLASAEHQSLHLLRVFCDAVVRLVDDPPEAGVGTHLLQGRHAPLVPEEVLRRDHDEGLAEVAVYLPPQAVEVVGGSGAVHDLDIGLLDLHPLVPGHLGNVVRILVHLLQEALHAA